MMTALRDYSYAGGVRRPYGWVLQAAGQGDARQQQAGERRGSERGENGERGEEREMRESDGLRGTERGRGRGRQWSLRQQRMHALSITTLATHPSLSPSSTLAPLFTAQLTARQTRPRLLTKAQYLRPLSSCTERMQSVAEEPRAGNRRPRARAWRDLQLHCIKGPAMRHSCAPCS